DGDADPRRLSRDTRLPRDRLRARHDTAGDEPLPALVLTREHENGISFRDVLAAVHRLLRHERERLRPRIGDVGLDREVHARGSAVRLTRRSLRRQTFIEVEELDALAPRTPIDV